MLAPGDIPVIQSDRAAMTYHGPGQITAYLLLDLRNRKMGVRDLVSGIELLQRLLALYGISSERARVRWEFTWAAENSPARLARQ